MHLSVQLCSKSALDLIFGPIDRDRDQTGCAIAFRSMTVLVTVHVVSVACATSSTNNNNNNSETTQEKDGVVVQFSAIQHDKGRTRKKNHSPSCAVVNQLGEHERDTSSGSKNQNGNHFEWSLIPFAHSFSKNRCVPLWECGTCGHRYQRERRKMAVESIFPPLPRFLKVISKVRGQRHFHSCGKNCVSYPTPFPAAFFGSSISAKRKWFSPPKSKVISKSCRDVVVVVQPSLPPFFARPKWRSTKYQSSLAEGKFLGTVHNTAVANPTNEGDNILSQTTPALHHSTYSRAKRAANWIGRSIPHPSLPPYQPDWPIRKNTALSNTG